MILRHFLKTTWPIILVIILFLAAGFFAFQWWQAKEELARQTEQNENLTKQIDELRKEMEKLKSAQGKITDETAGWKTYRNEKQGFEIKFPPLGRMGLRY